MSPHVIRSKVEQILTLLRDLRAFENLSYEQFVEHQHYAVERLLELLVITASDAVLHLLALHGEEMPTTLRSTFLRAGELHLLPSDLAQRLAQAAGMRNMLVHAYARLDLKVIFASIGEALNDFGELAMVLSDPALLPPEM